MNLKNLKDNLNLNQIKIMFGRMRRWWVGEPLRVLIMLNNDTKLIAVHATNIKDKLHFQRRHVNGLYFEGSQGIIVFFDKSNRASFENVRETYKKGTNILEKKLPCCLIGLKTDNDVVSFDEGQALAMELEIFYREGKGGEEMYQILSDLAAKWEKEYKADHFKWFLQGKRKRMGLEN